MHDVRIVRQAYTSRRMRELLQLLAAGTVQISRYYLYRMGIIAWEADMSRAYDLLVMGGGPGGTSAAITAARSGWRVLLVETGPFPRHKVCVEFVSTESLALLKWLFGGIATRLASAGPYLVGITPLPGWTHGSRPDQSVRGEHRSLRSRSRPLECRGECWRNRPSGNNVQGIRGEGPFRIATSAG